MKGKVILKKKISPRILNGHPWIFSNEVDSIDDYLKPGDVAEIFYGNGKFAGLAYVNHSSQIFARILTRRRDEEIDAAFFHRRIKDAWEFRKKLGYYENCRVVFGEADFLPALIVDKFNNYIVIQTLALGIDKWKDAIVDAIQEILKPAGIYERNDVPVRELEGLQQQKGFLSSPFDPIIIINENGLKFYVDVENGQKTGYFLDQQLNRKELQQIIKGAEVLGAFSYTGTFELHAAFYGAKKVLGIDISASAVEAAGRNAVLNGLEKICSFNEANAFDVLKEWSTEKREFDVVILDPPAFTKSRENISNAIAGYKEINLRALKLLRKGGFLITCSCSNLVKPEVFIDTINKAAADAKRTLRQITYKNQPPDHPIVWGIDNTSYLKFLIVQAL